MLRPGVPHIGKGRVRHCIQNAKVDKISLIYKQEQAKLTLPQPFNTI